MQPSPAGDLIIHVQDGSCVRGFHALDVETQDRKVVGGIFLAIHGNAIDPPQAFAQQGGQIPFMRGDVGDAQDPGNTGVQSGRPEDVRRPVFQAIGVFLQMEPVGRADARPARPRLADRDPLADIKSADAGRPEERFMAGEDQHVHEIGLDIDGLLAGRLRCVDREEDAVLPADAADLADRLDRADDVGGVIDDDVWRGGSACGSRRDRRNPWRRRGRIRRRRPR